MPYLPPSGPPFPNYRRVAVANDPRTRMQSPAMANPSENADAVLERQVVTNNRAGTDRGNPVLAGLGFHLTIPLGEQDALKGLFLFQNPGSFGQNLLPEVSIEAPGVWGYDFLVGSGRSKAGTPATGAVRNFVRVVTSKCSFERQFYAKSYDADIVTLNGEAALDPDTLDPVEVVMEVVDSSRDWLDVPVDFFLSWNDAFQALNARNDADTTAGFKKANGGALWVSFFDTDPGTEGEGTQVNPLTQVAIDTRRKIQVENTVGLKEITARFRSKKDATWFVDIPLLIRVIDQTEICLPPVIEPCTDLYIKTGDATPDELPSLPSTPGVQVTEGPLDVVLTDLLYVQVRGAAVGASPKLRIKKWKWVASSPALAGARLVQVGDVEDYLPLVQNSGGPEEDEPYGDPHRYTIALSPLALAAEDVAFLEVMLVDGVKPSEPVLIAGPQARAVQYMPLGGTGGGPVCSPY